MVQNKKQDKAQKKGAKNGKQLLILGSQFYEKRNIVDGYKVVTFLIKKELLASGDRYQVTSYDVNNTDEKHYEYLDLPKALHFLMTAEPDSIHEEHLQYSPELHETWKKVWEERQKILPVKWWGFKLTEIELTDKMKILSDHYAAVLLQGKKYEELPDEVLDE